MRIFHRERHRLQHSGWLRAAVLGANDGIVSTASLLAGVAASQATHGAVMVAGLAALVAGALSMAAGEYVSVSSQADTEKADIERERSELATNERHEREELAAIYVSRGLEQSLARQVAAQLMAKDALAAHLRDELGISDNNNARPLQAALTSALTFSLGAALPLLVAAFVSLSNLVLMVSTISLFSLALLGSLAAYTGGAPLLAGASRVTFWGALAMGSTAAVGALTGAALQ